MYKSVSFSFLQGSERFHVISFVLRRIVFADELVTIGSSTLALLTTSLQVMGPISMSSSITTEGRMPTRMLRRERGWKRRRRSSDKEIVPVCQGRIPRALRLSVQFLPNNSEADSSVIIDSAIHYEQPGDISGLVMSTVNVP